MHRSLPNNYSSSSEELSHTVTQVFPAISATSSNEQYNTYYSANDRDSSIAKYSNFLSPSPFANYDNSAIYNQSEGLVPKASYLLIKQAMPDFTKAVSWDSISKYYFYRMNHPIPVTPKYRNRPKFPFLLQIALGVKYTEWFEMQKMSYNMILHRKQIYRKSTVNYYCLLPRILRIQMCFFCCSANKRHASTNINRFACF